MDRRPIGTCFFAGFIVLILAGCGSTGGTAPPPQSFTIGGSVSGLVGSGLVLQNDGGDNLAVSANGSFIFAAPVTGGSAYAVTVFTQPSGPAQTCSVTNGSGTATSNITNIQVSCSTPATFTIGGTVSGLSGSGLVLQDNGGDNLSVSANGAFTFATPVANGGAYDVTVLTQPSGPTQTCTVADGTGTATSNVTSVQISCSTGATPVGEWTWMAGSTLVDQAGVYGTQGTPSTANTPGARVYSVSWTDAQGNFWLFGGYGAASTATQGDLNDLWKYSSGQWTWVGGSNQTEALGVCGTEGKPASGNVPGARWQAVSWIDPSGSLWLFGGLGIDCQGTRGDLNDLWRYSNGEWTWMSGSSVAAQPGIAGAYQGVGVYGTMGTPDPGNVPGVRTDAVSWSDAQGNLWLFGGAGVDANGNLGILNDLWKYANGEWTWMSGSNTVDAYGVYGTLGTAAPGNVPGARTNPVAWTDAQGSLWLFGGQGNDANGAICQLEVICNLNDLWKYANGEWAWMGGSNIADQSGAYGAEGVPSPGNHPGARWGAYGWIDTQGDLWLYGGNGFDSTVGPPQVYGDMNDLWEYSNGQWTWISGSDHAGETGTYGLLGVPSPANVPGARDSGVAWIDSSNNLWLFGGGDYLSVPGGGKMNDLWRYQGWGGGPPPPPPVQPPTYTVGGTVAGLTGSGLVLQDDNTDNLTISGNGSFTFSAPVTAGSAYSVTVLTQPGALEYCSVTNGSGIVTADVTNVQVACVSGASGHNLWTWMSGAETLNPSGNYGTLGTPSPSNAPPGRYNAMTWTDAHGNLWLFGGNDGGFANGLIGPGGQEFIWYDDFNDLWEYANGEWAWMGGSSGTTDSKPGVYGALGTASPNNVPGARHNAVTWTDTQGNFWLFGGIGIDSTGAQGDLNDLWEYANGEWTWMAGSDLVNQSGAYGSKGTPDSANAPGSRDSAVGWTDAQGNLWLFGGYGYDSTGTPCYNYGGNACTLNDLWEYSKGEWTWMGGSKVADQTGAYGAQGTPSTGNIPGARQNASAWVDSSGNFWLFGGGGFDAAGKQGLLNDLWKYSAGQWTWVSGANTANPQGSWGTEGTPASGNVPGSRYQAVSWADSSGNLWLFGGAGSDSAGNLGELNDLWKFSGGQWTWVSGSDVVWQFGSYGTEGVAYPGNVPPSRSGAAGWSTSGNFWLFGGSILGSSLNDLWRYQP